MGKNNVGLTSITPFKEDDHWYLKLAYKYIERGFKTPGYFFDTITDYASREMTLDEIEKKLGYKVKIINKEKSDGNGKKM